MPCRSRWSAVTFVYTATVVPRDSVGSCSSDSSMTTRWRAVSSGSRSTSGVPLLPPSTTGWAGSPARIAAIRAEVVVLPFVPVTPTVGAGQSRRNRSASETSTGTSRCRWPARPRAAEGPPQARLGCREVGRDRRRCHHEGRIGPGAPPGRRPAHHEAYRPALEGGDRGAELVRRAPVVDRHDGPGIRQEPRGRDAASGQPQDRYRPAGRPPSQDVGHRQRVRVEHSPGRRPSIVTLVTATGRWKRGRRRPREARPGCRRSRSEA